MRRPSRPLVAQQKTRDLIKSAQGGDNDALERLLAENDALVHVVACRYIGYCRHVMLSDLKQEGRLGLLHAIKKFDLNRPSQFSTYAFQWIRQRIVGAIRDTDREIRIPAHVQEKKGLFASRHLHGDDGLPAVIISLDGAVESEAARGFSGQHGGRDLYIREAFADTQVNVEAEVIGMDIEDEVLPLVAELPENERIAITLRYGLDNGGCRTLEEIGTAIGRSREGVRQIQQRGLQRLRRMLKERNQ